MPTLLPWLLQPRHRTTHGLLVRQTLRLHLISIQVPESPKNLLPAPHTIVSFCFTDSYLTDYELTPSLSAVLSDPFPTNLDNLPPGSNKRKTTSFVGQNKKPKRGSAGGRGRGRSRGSRGGRGGYTRKDKIEDLVGSDFGDDDTFDEPVEVQESVETPLVEGPRGARRSSRFTTSVHPQSTSKQAMNGAQAGMNSDEDRNNRELEEQNNAPLHRRMPRGVMLAPIYDENELARRGLQRSEQPHQPYQTPNRAQRKYSNLPRSSGFGKESPWWMCCGVPERPRQAS
jgi:hypothetical protein